MEPYALEINWVKGKENVLIKNDKQEFFVKKELSHQCVRVSMGLADPTFLSGTSSGSAPRQEQIFE